MADQSPQAVYASNGWEIDLTRRELRSRGVSVPIGSRAFEILEALVRSGGELVNKSRLMDQVWPGAIVEENTLQFHISAIRKALGADRGLLKTVSGRGYRLLGSWNVRQASGPEHRAGLPESKPRQPFRTNVPIAGSALIGRSAPRQHLLNVLSAYRVVTLTGPGGIGKSVLALEIARSVFPTLEGDCWFVELASLSDPALVASAVALTLGLRMGGNEISAESVARAIGEQKLLLVLDNCEHLADTAAGLAETIVRMCPHVSVLATSREILRIEGEYVYRLPPLDVPLQRLEDTADINQCSAVQLFNARLAALDSGFSASPENLSLIASICRQLDGIPLAIEFAAARATTLGFRQVADRLNDRFGLLKAGRRTALPRQQTLRATLDWSYELLRESERAILRRISIFAGHFTLTAAIATAYDEIKETEFTNQIGDLVLKSLVTTDIGSGFVRYRLFETTRAYAIEKLRAAGEFNQTARVHAAYFADLLYTAWSEAGKFHAEGGYATLKDQIGNVRAGLQWVFSDDGDTLLAFYVAAGASMFFARLGLMAEAYEWSERGLRSMSPAQRRTQHELMLRSAHALSSVVILGNADTSTGAILALIELAKELKDPYAQIRALGGYHIYLSRSGMNRAALSVAEQVGQIARDMNDEVGLAMANAMLSQSFHYAGDQAKAEACFSAVLRQAPLDEKINTLKYGTDQRVRARDLGTHPVGSWPASEGGGIREAAGGIFGAFGRSDLDGRSVLSRIRRDILAWRLGVVPRDHCTIENDERHAQGAAVPRSR